MPWKLQEAKQKFTELVDLAVKEGPQVVTRNGQEVVVVLAIDAYRKLLGCPRDFKAFLLSAPDLSQLDLDRRDESTRDMDR